MANQMALARYIIKCDEYLLKNPDEPRDVLEDIRSFAVDLARTIITDSALEYDVRQAVKSDTEE